MLNIEHTVRLDWLKPVTATLATYCQCSLSTKVLFSRLLLVVECNKIQVRFEPTTFNRPIPNKRLILLTHQGCLDSYSLTALAAWPTTLMRLGQRTDDILLMFQILQHFHLWSTKNQKWNLMDFDHNATSLLYQLILILPIFNFVTSSE